MIFAFTPFVVAFWARQARRGAEPSTLIKMALGCFGSAAAYLIMAAAALYAGPAKASWLWLFAYFVGHHRRRALHLADRAFPGLQDRPGRHVAMMMGVWLATSFAGNFLAGYLGSFWSSMHKPAFFLMIAAIAVAAGVTIWAFDRPLRAALRH